MKVNLFLIFGIVSSFTIVLGEDSEICSQKPDRGGCRSVLIRWFYNTSSQKCERFVYGGCTGNKNNFVSERLCTRKCVKSARTEDICSLPKNTGPCRAYFKRFWYNKQTRKCEDFIWGGCGENDNNFETPEECVQTCKAKGVVRYYTRRQKRSEDEEESETEEDFDICLQKPSRAPCYEIGIRYFYNSTNGRCEISYGGCKKSENSFTTFQECKEKCQDRAPKIDFPKNESKEKQKKRRCYLKKHDGYCRGKFDRYYYDASRNKCLPFTFGGCFGNLNNFKSLKSCEKLCVDRN
ncbi:tissue factor pathway inhibitor 2-like isoform X4 [Dinothrombium tinctorium]|uniref:Tissue factor pathway inhibitor 2-like isoform X4 n=1 Tax=Dinothrombium tinctorium TaxID=1965070 RepID=A0A443QIA7_9ACAR|nr:tissue factor pathway inhibitor 2-like isoform X4 [Dinothrombium tinctorium]RWS05334.1 tissue factor pathway inhibitor 2-like isoform X4 [Dinothrombium tinctorium]RWS05340.1 tissue factor pathway inhibitor 2-like isoform X4 [Dinothrombium tinctorium]